MGIVRQCSADEEEEEEEEESNGVVLDLDHAIYVDTEEGRPTPGYVQSAQDRTGTIPFKALDLHCPIRRGLEDKYPAYHLPRYDLEAFIWVFIWLLHETSKTTADAEATTLMDQWNSQNPEDIRRSKESLIKNYELHPSRSKIKDSLAILTPLMHQLLKLLQVSLIYSSPTNAAAEAERRSWPAGRTHWYHTLGGRFTVDAVLQILVQFEEKVGISQLAAWGHR